MRPDPDQRHDRDETGRVIYLGDVRKRRGMRRMAPDRHYLLILALIALAGWIAWLTVLLTLQPARLLTYLAFFIPLAVALTGTGALAVYGIEWRRGEFPSMTRCVERGALVAGVIILNLAFQGAHRWNPIVAVVGIALALGADTLYGFRAGHRR